MVQEVAKCEFRIVHFDGGAQQITGVLGGHVDCAFDNVGGVFKRVQSGEVRGLAVTDSERSKFLPNALHQGARHADDDLLLDPRRRRAQGHAGRRS